MSYPIRIESTEIASFQTVRTRNSELWFVNNKDLEEAILGYAARYTTRYEVKMYALAIEGNHTHNLSHFPKANRASFMRDFNSSVARSVIRYQDKYPGGTVFGRRYSTEYVPGHEDIESKFFYTVLQPVQDGLVDDIEDYKGYNCFEDAIYGRERKCKVVNWKRYNAAKKRNPEVSMDEYTEIVTLKYARLPGFESLSQEEYIKVMREKLKEYTVKALEERKCESSLGPELLEKVQPGSLPKNTKTSSRYEPRPHVIAKDAKLCASTYEWVRTTFAEHKEASRRFRAGELTVEFPKGTYRPPMFTVAFTGQIA